MVETDEGIVAFEAETWQPRRRPWFLSEEVAHALGTMSRPPAPVTHGDFAPWNLMRTARGWTVIDWEDASGDDMPFEDLFHFLVQGHAHLGHPTQDEIIRGLEERGWVGAALTAYAQGAETNTADARTVLLEYLEGRLSRRATVTADAGEDRRRRLAARLRA